MSADGHIKRLIELYGLFARADWRDISGCCLCRVEGSVVRYVKLWENPRAGVSFPPQVHSALNS
jgi:hypothetical protein